MQVLFLIRQDDRKSLRMKLTAKQEHNLKPVTSYFNNCDVTVANSNHKICYNFFSTCTCAPPLWKTFRHLWLRAL